MNLPRIASKYIKTTSNKEETVFADGDTQDIISVILAADQQAKNFTADFAPYLKGRTEKESAENAWGFVKTNIRYQKDRPGSERIKSPGKLWEDRTGDCKSFSVFLASIFQNLGIRYKYRFAHYPTGRLDRDVNHVFVVAIDRNGKEIPVDAVADYFNYEEPYEYSIDYDPVTGQKAGVNGTSSSSVPSWAKVMLAILVGVTVYDSIRCKPATA